MNLSDIQAQLEQFEGMVPDTVTVVTSEGQAWKRDDARADWREIGNAWDDDIDSRLRILAITPFHPAYGIKDETWASIRRAIDAYEGAVDWIISNGDNPHNRPFENVTYQHNKARKLALDGGYDALLSIEADMVLPEDTIQHLVDLDADIAYALYVWRHHRKRWSAYSDLDLFGGTSISLDHTGEDARQVWGKQIDVAGLGMGCTLIRRNVLETTPFRLYNGDRDDWLIEKHGQEMARVGIDPYRPRRGMLCDDYLLALDAQHYGFTQRCDLGLVCGHINGESVLWPDPDAPKLYREEQLNGIPEQGEEKQKCL